MNPVKNKSKNFWFISDLHFDHKNILEYSDRPFKTVEEMNESIIKRILRKVKPNDVLVIVGDFYLGGKKQMVKNFTARLKAAGITLVLVRGNHDYKNVEMMNCGFDLSVDKFELEIANETVTVMHYPYRGPIIKYYFYYFLSILLPKKFWKERFFWQRLPMQDKYLIHGHTHSHELQRDYQINVSAEAVNYEPINTQKIAELICNDRNRRLNETSWIRRWNSYVNRIRSRYFW